MLAVTLISTFLFGLDVLFAVLSRGPGWFQILLRLPAIWQKQWRKNQQQKYNISTLLSIIDIDRLGEECDTRAQCFKFHILLLSICQFLPDDL